MHLLQKQVFSLNVTSYPNDVSQSLSFLALQQTML